MSSGAGKEHDEQAPDRCWEWASPEHKLAAGMLELAMADLKAGKEPHKTSALAWIKGHDGWRTDSPVSFESVCQTLKLSITGVRRKLLGE